MEIKIEDFLSKDEMRKIAIETFRDFCAAKFHADAERIVSNAAYDTAHDIVSDALGDSMDELIAKKALDVINNLSEFTVFRKPDAWDRKSSPAYDTLMQCVVENKDAIRGKVDHAIKTISKHDAIDIIKSKEFKLS